MVGFSHFRNRGAPIKTFDVRKLIDLPILALFMRVRGLELFQNFWLWYSVGCCLRFDGGELKVGSFCCNLNMVRRGFLQHSELQLLQRSPDRYVGKIPVLVRCVEAVGKNGESKTLSPSLTQLGNSRTIDSILQYLIVVVFCVKKVRNFMVSFGV